jgi:hypothetical protein
MKLLSYVALILCFSLSVFAEPFNGNRVPEKAKWYIHFDMDNFKNTTIGKDIIAKVLENQDTNKFNDVLKLLGIDPVKTLKNITIYGLDVDKKNWLIAFEGSIYVVKLLDLIKTNGSYEVNVNNGIDVYNTKINGHKFYFFMQDSIFYISKESDLINSHIQMIIGKEKSIKDSLNASNLPTDSMIIFGSADRLPDDGKDATMSNIIKIVTKISGGVKEENGTIKTNAILQTADNESADTLNQFLQGVLGLGKLKFANNQVMLDAIKSVVVTKEGNSIKVNGSISSDSLISIINQHEAKKQR